MKISMHIGMSWLAFACVLLIGVKLPTAYGQSVAPAGSVEYWFDGSGNIHYGPRPGNNYQPPAPLTAAQVQAQQQAEAERQQRLATATAQNQQGIDAWNNGDVATAVTDFQNALHNNPGDPVISSHLNQALKWIQDQKAAAERQSFEVGKIGALQRLKGVNVGVGFTPHLKFGDSGAFKQLKAANTDDGSFDTGVKSSSASDPDQLKGSPISRSAVQPEPFMDSSVVDLRDIDNLTIDPAKLKEAASAAGQKLAGNPDYRGALDQGIAAYVAGHAAVEQTAIGRLQKINWSEVAHRPEVQQIFNGLALPKSQRVDELLKEHPELKPQILAMWKNACDERIKWEKAAMADAVRKLAASASQLGLRYGHIEETVAKDPNLNAEWQGAVSDATAEVVRGEQIGMINETADFHRGIQNLQPEAVNPPKTP